MTLPDLPPPKEKLSDDAIAALLNKDAFKASLARGKNFRLAGTGLNPLLIYASAVGFVLLWFFGAWALSMFGPFVALLVTLGVCGTATFYSVRQSQREARVSTGLCPMCGYDLYSNDRCPECGEPIPEPILRWRGLARRRNPACRGMSLPTFRASRRPNGRRRELSDFTPLWHGPRPLKRQEPRRSEGAKRRREGEQGAFVFLRVFPSRFAPSRLFDFYRIEWRTHATRHIRLGR